MRITVKKVILLVLGMAILAFGMYNVHSRCDITEGGVLGLTLLLQNWFGISPSISSLLLDFVFFLMGLFVLGGGFLVDSVIASVSFSLWYALFEHVGPLLPNLSGKPLLAAIVGGIFVGVGTGLVVQFGGAPGGDDALALVLNKKFHIQVSSVYYVFDTIVMVLSLSYIPVLKIVYSLLTVYISSTIINYIHIYGPDFFKIKEELR